MEVDQQSTRPCGCGREGHIAEYRCLDCDHRPVKCRKCILNAHRALSLHRIEVWDSNRFATTSLFDLGHVMHLGHSGDPCPNLSNDPLAEPAESDSTCPANPAIVGSRRNAEQISVVHTRGIRPVAIRYCACLEAPSHIRQLLQVGLVPGSPKRPETAFSIDMLGLYHTLNMESGLSMYNFYKTLVRRTDNIFTKDVPVCPTPYG